MCGDITEHLVVTENRLCSTKETKLASQTVTELETAFAKQSWPSVERLAKKVLRKQPTSLAAHRMLGYALHELGKTEAALLAFKSGAAFWPEDAELLINYANVLIGHARNIEASALLDKVCELRPEKAIAWIKLSQACYITQQHLKGYAAAEKGVELAEDKFNKVSALIQRAIHRRELGQIKAAIEDCEDAINIYPNFDAAHTNRLLFMLADPQTSPEQLTQAAKEYGEIFESPYKPYWPNYEMHRGEPWRKLRIGFLSPDFRVHAVMCFAEGILAQLDRRQFEVYAFYLYPKGDLVTERVKCHVDHFIHLSHLSYEEQAKLIQSNDIDILIDMTGHTGCNALLTMARKPAPVQVSWLGFAATTGLTAIDYYLADEVITPPGVDHLFIEQLYRVPTAGTYRPLSRNPLWRYQPLYEVRSTPALQNGFITFGSCNNLGKLTNEVLTLWGQLLTRVPDSRLLIEGKGFAKKSFADEYRAKCESLGINKDRLVLLPLDPSKQYLAYHDIDIALDPFPMGGGTTTHDLLWMSVPLVTLEGNSFPSRMGTSALTILGRAEWIARTHPEYLDIAINLSSDISRLNDLRQNLRQEMEQSPLMRDDIVCPYFASALRTMWLRWQAKLDFPDDVEAQERCVNAWQLACPEHLTRPPPPRVGIATAVSLSVYEAHQRLQELVDNALTIPSNIHQKNDVTPMSASWTKITELAEMILCAIPNDPVALACLAEVEHANGHTDFALTYLRYSTLSIMRQ